jgi:hypothetical protein
MAGIVRENNCHLLLRIPVSVLRQTSRPTKNPILTDIIQLGPSTWITASEPTPIRLERDSFARRNPITMHNTTYISARQSAASSALPFNGVEHNRTYYCNRHACRHCELKSRCTTNPYRQVARLIDEEVLDRDGNAAESESGNPEATS